LIRPFDIPIGRYGKALNGFWQSILKNEPTIFGGCRTRKRGGKLMDRAHHHGSLRNKKAIKNYPEVYIDQDADFDSIKIGPGVESRSYVKDGIVVCEDQKGHVIEIQLLNLK